MLSLSGLGRASWYILGITAVIALAIVLVAATRSVSIPLLLAVVAGVVFNPLVDVFARHMGRGAAAGAVLLIIVAAITGVTALFIAAIVDQGDEIVDGIRDGVAQLEDALEGALGADRLDQARGSVESLADVGTDGVAAWLVDELNSFAGVVGGVVLGLVLLYYLLADYAAIDRWLVGALSGGRRVALVQQIFDDGTRTLQGYFKGQTIIAAADAAVVGIGALVIGVPLPLTIALITFFFAYIPYVGAFLSGALAVLLAMSTGDSWRAIAMLAIFLLANTVIDNILSPKLQGAEIGLNPIVVLLAVAVGGGAAGIVGAILGAPVVAIAYRTLRLLREDDDGPGPAESTPAAKGPAPPGRPAET